MVWAQIIVIEKIGVLRSNLQNDKDELHLVHSLLEVGNDVIDILETDREANQVWSDAGSAKLFVRELTVSMAGRMEYAGLGIGHMGHNADELQVVHKADSRFARTIQAECDNATGTVRHILLLKGMVFVTRQI